MLQILRLRKQTERLARLKVARARSEADAAKGRWTAARKEIEQQAAELASRLQRSESSLVIQQATLSLRDSESIAEQLSAVHAAAVEELNKTIESYHRTQQEREIVERAVERQQKEHRREQARVAAIDLQDWIMRPKQAPVATDREEVNYA